MLTWGFFQEGPIASTSFSVSEVAARAPVAQGSVLVLVWPTPPLPVQLHGFELAFRAAEGALEQHVVPCDKQTTCLPSRPVSSWRGLWWLCYQW